MNAALCFLVTAFGAHTIGLVNMLGTTPFIVGLIGSAICYALIQWFSSLPRSWTERIGNLLSSYEPVDIDAYRQLQDQTVTFDLETHYLEEWIRKERKAIDDAIGSSHKQLKFLSKKL